MRTVGSLMVVFLLVPLALPLSRLWGAGAGGEGEPVVRMTLHRAVALADSGKNLIHVVDADGEIVWQYPAERPRDVWVLEGGNVLFNYATGVKEVTRDKQVVWEYTFPATSEIHACQPLGDGLVMIAESGPMRIVEVDRQGKVVRTVQLQSGETNKHRQMRCCRKLPDGHYLVGQYYDGAIREYDEEGRIVGEIVHSNAHAGLRLPGGNTLCSFGDAHRLVEYDREQKAVWAVEENDLAGCPLRFVGPAWRLANGNTIICNWAGHGFVGKQAQLVEITPEKKIVGELFDYVRFGTISGFFVIDSAAR
ncbi:MAG: beta-propeller domain-containing protein [Thermoguttaceae bacterium]